MHVHMPCRQKVAIWLQTWELAPGRSKGYHPFPDIRLGILAKTEWAVEGGRGQESSPLFVVVVAF